MKEIIKSEDIKSICIEGLRQLKAFCNDHGLRYYLAYGTLLGSIRHNGFIPWDDDIDIWMPREDYDKLCDLLADQIPGWELLTCKKNRKYLYEWAKLANLSSEVWPSRFRNGYLYGISIDIFPLENIEVVNEAEAKDVLNKCVHAMADFRSTSRTISGGLEYRNNRFLWFRMQMGYLFSTIRYGNANDRLNNILSNMPKFSGGGTTLAI